MTEFIFTNNAETVLAADIGGGDTAFAVTDGGDFPSPTSGQGFHIMVEEGSKKEFMLVTTRSGNNFSGITREGSESFSAGSTVRMALHKDAMNAMVQKGAARTYDGDPDTVLAAQYTGEEVYDSTNFTWYKHCTGTTWKEMTT